MVDVVVILILIFLCRQRIPSLIFSLGGEITISDNSFEMDLGENCLAHICLQ